VIGIRLMRTKLLAFAISSFYCGVAGALYAFAYLGTVEPEGLQSGPLVPRAVHGHHRRRRKHPGDRFLGAAFIVLLPIFLNTLAPLIENGLGLQLPAGLMSNLELIVFGSLIIFFLVVEPHGLARLWQIGKEKLRLWPFPH
jgi:branched-chain amino acid transport system permease protein